MIVIEILNRRFTMNQNNEIKDNFVKARDSFAESLSEWSNALTADPECSQKVSDLLDNLVPEIDLLKELGRIPNVNDCFQHRCQVIKFTIEDCSLLLRAKSHSTSEISEVLTMISVQVGRLVLIPCTGDDEIVSVMDRIASKISEKMNLAQAGTTHISLFLRDMWIQLHFPVDGCYCGQCLTLRGDTPSR